MTTVTTSKIRKGSHSDWGCTLRGQTRQYGIERGGPVCYLGPFGTHLNLAEIAEAEEMNWMTDCDLFWDFSVLGTEPASTVP